MNLALEAKPFINSEHTGEYVEILMPIAQEPEQTVPSGKKKGLFQKKQEESLPEESAADATEAEIPEPEPAFEKIKLHYMEAGTGEPMILVHTVGQSIYTWRKQFQRLSEYYRVIAIDLPGHGYSDRPVEFDYTLEEQAQVLSLFMDALQIQSAHFIGFSMGAMYVLEFLRRNPDRAGRAILINPGGVTQEMPLLVRMLDNPVFGVIASRLYNLKMVRGLLEDSCFDLTVITDDVVREYYRTVSDPDARRAIRFCLHNYDDDELIRNLRSITTNILILHGEEDKWHVMEDISLLHVAMPNTTLQNVRNVGHLAHEEKPDKLITFALEHIPVLSE